MSKNKNTSKLEEKLAEIGLTVEEAIDWLTVVNKRDKVAADERFFITTERTACGRNPCCNQDPCVIEGTMPFGDIDQESKTSNLSLSLKQDADRTTVYVDGVQVTNVTNLALTYDSELGLPIASIEIINPEIL
jgi:hypothetical protein